VSGGGLGRVFTAFPWSIQIPTICTNLFVCICTFISLHICTYVHMQICIFVYLFTRRYSIKAMRWNTLQHTATHCNTHQGHKVAAELKGLFGLLILAFVTVQVCNVMQCGALCCSMLQCVVVCCNALRCDAVQCSVLQRVAVCCSVLQCGAVCCSVLQCFS